ncbi:F-box protein At4g22390-like [Silene latifolia]|uniref:F-box protein At4g22390-like n=1 Tax=Silene latifolia TaxID=37657 RepID=UPI003D77F34E
MASNPIFPDEIIIEILLKLPVKSILRCNTLSKHYYSLIHSQFFIRRHLNLVRLTNDFNDCSIVSPIGDPLLFNGRLRCFKRLQSSSSLVRNDIDELVISGPIDGLYCVIDRHNVFRRCGLSIWNPATSEEFILPLIPLANDKFEVRTIEEFFDDLCTREKCLAYGFGYDRDINNCKVVIIYQPKSMSVMVDNMFMYIFNVSERTWKYHEERFSMVKSWSMVSFAGVFVSGACHWIRTFLKESNPSICFCQILAFDMSTDSSRAISFPYVGDGYTWSKFTSIATLNGCLALIDAVEEDVEGRCSSFNVWVMADYGITKSWSKIHRISLTPTIIVDRFLGIIGDRLL